MIIPLKTEQLCCHFSLNKAIRSSPTVKSTLADICKEVTLNHLLTPLDTLHEGIQLMVTSMGSLPASPNILGYRRAVRPSPGGLLVERWRGGPR